MTSALLVLAGLPVVLTSLPAAAANAPLTCGTGTIYNLSNNRTLYALNTTTGVNTPAAPSTLGNQSTPNGLGISADGKTAFTIDQTTSGGNTTVDVEDIVAGTFTSHSVSVAGISGLIAGGVNPVNGLYYYGGWNSASTTFILYSYNPTSGVGTEVGTVTPPGGGTFGSGDLAFDGAGNLYIMAGASGSGKILAVPGPLPAAGTAALNNTVLSTLSGRSTFNGIAFSADGKLYAQDSAGTFKSINPNTGVATSLPNESGPVSGTMDDLASCAFTGSLVAEKNIVGRVAAGDQFKVTITGGGVSSGNTGTTTGATTGLQTGAGEIAGPVIGIPGQTYTVTETAAGTTNLANYASAYSCSDAAGASIASGNGTTGSFTFPQPTGNQGAAVTCVFTNTPASLSITKTPNPTTASPSTATITYTFVVKNTGPLTLNNVSVTDAQTAPSSNSNLTAITCTPGPNGSITLAPNGTTTCTATYTLSQADKDNGSIKDTATATGSPTGGTPISATASATVQVFSAPAVTVTKSASVPSVTAAGQTFTYSLAVKNTGNVTLTLQSAVDNPVSPAGSVTFTCQTGPIVPGATATCTSSPYTVSQADMDNGSIKDTATISFTVPGSQTPILAMSNQVTVTATQSPALTVTKKASPTTVTAAGQTVTYTVTVLNSGNVTVSTPSVVDHAVLPATPVSITCPAGSLAPGMSVDCTGTYTVTQADIDAGSIKDTATGSATPVGSQTSISSDSAQVTVSVTKNPSLKVEKSASPTSVSAVGQTVTYTFVITNDGNLTETNVGVTDAQAAPSLQSGLGAITCTGGTNGSITLAPKASVTCTADYTVTQADLDNGSINDTGTASGKAPDGSTTTSPGSGATVSVAQTKTLMVTKQANRSSVTAAGQTINYTVTVKNTGNVTVSGVSAVDVPVLPAGSVTFTCTPTTLAPQASASCTGSYAVTQTDMDHGSVVDTVTASATPAGSHTPIMQDSNQVTVTATQSPALTVEKTTTTTSVSKVGDQIPYTVTVTNSGNVTVTNVGVTDNPTAPAGSVTFTCTPAGSLAPGDATTCSGTYTVTQADLDAGSVKDTATGSATPTGSQTPITKTSDQVTVPVTQTAAFTVVKSTTTTSVSHVGDQIPYTVTVTNSGNVTLTNVGVTDNPTLPAGSVTFTCTPAGSLAPGDAKTCTGTYTVTQDDLDAGSVKDTATATATGPGVQPVPKTSDLVTVPVNQTPALTVVKSTTTTSVSKVGDQISYSFLVTNSGNVTESHVGVSDALGGASLPSGLSAITCPNGGNGGVTLAPGAMVTCTATYTVTQADLDYGSVSDTGTASGTTPGGSTTTSPGSMVTVPVTQTAAFTVVKSTTTTSVSHVGDQIPYTVTVTNSGNVTLTNVGVTDNPTLPAGSVTFTCTPAGSLAPGDAKTCTGTYTVTQDDLDAGSVKDTATATATGPGSQPMSKTSNLVTVPVNQTPALTVTKKALPTTVTGAGQTVTYTVTVTNSGNVTMSTPSAVDHAVAPATSVTFTCPPGSLAPGQSVDCTGTYAVSQADIDAGSIKDTATGSATPAGSQTPISSDSGQVTVSVTQNPSLKVDKSASPQTVSTVGQTVTYTFTVTNNGNVTETNVGVTDAQALPSLPAGLGPITCAGGTNGSITLAPNASVTCTATYTVTQADLDNGSISDIGTATGTTPGGSTTTSPGSGATVTATQTPGLLVTKSADLSSVTATGQTINYTVTVKNSGNVTVTNVSVVDVPISPAGSVTFTCAPAGPLAPGSTRTCTSGPYTVTQADMDAGSIKDTATASATPSGSQTPIMQGSNLVAVTATQNPALSVVKTASPTTVTAVGQTVTYSFKVTNTGNVTIHNVAISDTQTAPSSSTNLSAITCPQPTLAPGASETCTATYHVTQADLNHGSITDTAVATGLTPSGATVNSAPSMATVKAIQIILSGRAYAVGIAAKLAGLALVGPSTVDDTGSILTAASTSTPNPCAANLAVTDIVLTGDVCAGVTTVANTSSTATASVANASVSIATIPTIVVKAVQSTSTTTCAGSSGSVTIAYLAVGGVVLINKPTPIAPNTGLNVGVVKLVLNQQIPFGGVDPGLTVNAIAISVNALGLATANVVIASSTSDIMCAAPYTSPTLSGQASDLNITATALSGSVIGDITVNQTSPVVTNVASTTPAPCVAAAIVTDVVFTGDLCASVTTKPTVGSVPASSTASASVANATIGVPSVPAIAVQGVQSTSTTTCAGSSGSVTIAYLKIGSTVVIAKPTTIAPNTRVVVGVVTIVLNQQIPITGADSGLIVNAIAITANAGVAQLRATVASSTSDILNC